MADRLLPGRHVPRTPLAVRRRHRPRAQPVRQHLGRHHPGADAGAAAAAGDPRPDRRQGQGLLPPYPRKALRPARRPARAAEEQLAALRASLLPLRQTLARQPYLAGQQPAYADYAVFGFFMWARCTSALELLAADDPVAAWRERLLDAHGGLARQAPVAAA
ncbi:glutathione binding-like protein [Achromobacter xylosoxidans]